MSEDDFNGLLARGVEAVLETMFFTSPLSPADTDAGEAVLVAQVDFEGEPSGSLGVRISETGARSLASAFLGEDEESLTAIHIGQVVCELANMLCGWLLSQFENDRHFDLSAPQLLCTEGETLPCLPSTTEESFALENGFLIIALHLDVPHEH